MRHVERVEGRTATGEIWSICYTVIGQGPDVLLLHGAGPGATGLSNFIKNIVYLSKHFRCWVIDFPGFGQSSKNLAAFGGEGPFQNAGKSALAFMSAVGLEKAHIVGTSLGGAAALCMAIEQPELLGRIVLGAPGGGHVKGAKGPTDAVKQLFGYYPNEGPTREKMATFLGNLVYDRTLLTPELVDERYRASLNPEVVENPPLAGPPGGPGRELLISLDPRLSAVQTRTLFVWGLQDQCNPVDGLKPFFAMPAADYMLLSACGHWPHWEHAERFNMLTRGFLLQG